jgi:hypothetical protein
MSKSLSALVDKSISKPFFSYAQTPTKDHLEREFIKLEPSAPYAGTQLKSAECSGGGERENPYNGNRSKFFPEDLWATIYIHNRTPRRTYDDTYSAYRDGAVNKQKDGGHVAMLATLHTF